MNAVFTGHWYFTTDGMHVKMLQANERTYFVENVAGKKFHINHKELGMKDTLQQAGFDLRKHKEPSIDVHAKLVPEHYDIHIDGKHIEFFSDAELFDIIQQIESEMLELEQINNRPIALAKLLDSKRTSINHIIAWMNARK